MLFRILGESCSSSNNGRPNAVLPGKGDLERDGGGLFGLVSVKVDLGDINGESGMRYLRTHQVIYSDFP